MNVSDYIARKNELEKEVGRLRFFAGLPPEESSKKDEGYVELLDICDEWPHCPEGCKECKP